MNRTKPQLGTPISYYGGKQSLLHHILPLIPDHDSYTEVFLGGGSVFFAKVPAKGETINDVNHIVVNFYQVLKTNYSELKKMIDATLVCRYQHTKAKRIVKHPEKADKVTLAWAFWMATTFSFANKWDGGLKYSNDICTSVPKTMQNKKKEFTEYLVARIENCYIECGDALKILRSRNVHKTFHYIDPPYINADQGHYKGYTVEQFTELLEWCAKECKGKFLLSNYNSDILDIYINRYGWHKKEITLRISARHHKLNRKDKTEVLIWNYNVNEEQQQLFNY